MLVEAASIARRCRRPDLTGERDEHHFGPPALRANAAGDIVAVHAGMPISSNSTSGRNRRCLFDRLYASCTAALHFPSAAYHAHTLGRVAIVICDQNPTTSNARPCDRSSCARANVFGSSRSQARNKLAPLADTTLRRIDTSTVHLDETFHERKADATLLAISPTSDST